ncbi:MAG: ATP-binding protein [Elusimicrobiota bacterium]
MKKNKIFHDRPLVILRWLIIAFLIAYSVFCCGGCPGRVPAVLFLMLIISNLILGFKGRQITAKSRLLKIIFLLDISSISIIMYLSGQQIDLFLLYAVVILNSAVYFNFNNILFTLILVFAAFLTVYGVSDKFSITEFSTLMRLPFFFMIAGFAAYMSGESKRFKNEKEKIEMLYNALTGALDSGIIGVDINMEILFSNGFAENLLGINRLKQSGQNLAELNEFEGLVSIFSKTMDTGKNQVRKEAIVKSLDSGKEMLIGCTTSLIRDKTGKISGAIAIFRDISEITREREEKEQLKKRALIGESAAGIAHEIKNTFSVISGMAQNMDSYFSEKPEKVREYCRIMKEEVDKALGIINDIRDITKASNVDFSKIKIGQFIGTIVDHYHFNLIGSSVLLDCRIDLDEEYVIYGAAGMIEQVVVNLVRNAEEAVDKETGKISVKVFEEQGMACISVSDNGHGIPEEIEENIFKPFFTTKTKGTGLGLSICSRIIELHGGKLDVSSSKSGTQFTIRLPKSREVNSISDST